MYRFEQVGGFHYKYRFKRATADVSTPCTSRHGAGRGWRGTRGAGDGPCIRASLFRDGTLEERSGRKVARQILTVRVLAEAKDRHGGHERRPEGGADERERRPHAAGFNQARAQESAVREIGKVKKEKNRKLALLYSL